VILQYKKYLLSQNLDNDSTVITFLDIFKWGEWCNKKWFIKVIVKTDLEWWPCFGSCSCWSSRELH